MKKTINTEAKPRTSGAANCSPRWVSLGRTWFADALRIYQEMDAAMRSYTAREMGIERIDFYIITRDKLEHWSWEGHGIRRDKATLHAFAVKHGHVDWAALKQWLRREHEMSFHGFVVTWANVSDQATASARHGIHDRQPTSGCLHPSCSPLVGGEFAENFVPGFKAGDEVKVNGRNGIWMGYLEGVNCKVKINGKSEKVLLSNVCHRGSLAIKSSRASKK